MDAVLHLGRGIYSQRLQAVSDEKQSVPSVQPKPRNGHEGASRQANWPEQFVSQVQESEQSMPPAQLSRAVQPTEQAPGPHSMGPAQASREVQRTSQESAAEQSTPDLQEFRPSQMTVQARPGGQTTGSAHDPSSRQSMAQVS